MLTQQQLEERKNYIGGSDAAVIAGISPYKNRVTLWLEKTGQVEIEDISNNPVIQFGNYMEDGVAQWFQDNTGKKIHPKNDEKIIHSKHSWMVANIDRRLIDENAALECKTAGKPGEEWGDGENKIPLAYQFQCAHYCEVGDFDRIYICVVFSLTREFRWYVYERNQQAQNDLILLEGDFWFNHVVANVAPEPVSADEVKALYKDLNPNPIIADHEIETSLYQIRELKNKIKLLEKQSDILLDTVAVFMGENETLLDAQGKPLATFKFTKAPTRFDKDSLEKDYPQIYAQYVKVGTPTRRFDIKVK